MFEEAVRLWAPGHDWSTAILDLPIDATAGRFPRRSDALPLRTEQHTLSLETVEELTERLENGILKWRFIPLSELSRIPRKLGQEDERLYRVFCDQSVKKKQLAPLAFALAKQLADVNMGREQLQLCSSEKALIRAGGVHVYAEQLTLRPDCLDSLGCCAVAFIPALSPRGPNGAWLIERGPNHPLVKAFSSVTAWALAERDGTVVGVQFAATEDDGRQICVEGMELFASKEAAQDMENSFVCLDDQVGDDADKLVPRLLSGAQILGLMGGLDVLMLSDGDELPLTQDGLRYCRALGEPGMEIVFADQVAKRLVHQTPHV